MRLGRIDLLLHWASEAEGVAERRYFIAEARRALPLVEPEALLASDNVLAEKAGLSLGRRSQGDDSIPPHSVIVPFAVSTLGISRRLVVSFAAFDQTPRAKFSNETTQAVREALHAASQIARPPHPVDRFRLTMWRPGLEGTLFVTGQSLGPAAFVSACALWLERRVRPGTAVTGVLRGRDVVASGNLAEKIEGLSWRGDVSRLLVARGEGAIARSLFAQRGRADVDVVEVANLDELLLESVVAERVASADADESLHALRRDFERGWQAFEWPTLQERAERLLGSLEGHRPDIEVELWTLTAAARRHAGDSEGSQIAITRAKVLAKSERTAIPDTVLCRLHLHASMTTLALGQRSKARSEADKALQLAGKARLRGEAIKALGCVGLVARASGRIDEAVRAQEEALRLVHAYKPSACARSHAYIIDALGESGDVAHARRAFHEGLDHLRGLPTRRAKDHESWLRVAFGGALVRNLRHREALLVLDVPCVHQRIAADANPGLWARRYLGVALLHDAATFERGAVLLAQSPGAYPMDPRSKLATSAALNVLLEAVESLRANRMTPDVEARACQAAERVAESTHTSFPRFAETALQKLIARAQLDGF